MLWAESHITERRSLHTPFIFAILNPDQIILPQLTDNCGDH
jgi:hypothetical protein